MKTILTVVLTLAAANIGYGQPLSSERQIVFRNVSVVSPDDERVIERQTVVIDDGRIITVGDVGKVSHDADALIIAADGKFLMPGLAEMHAHVPPTDDVQSMKEVLMLFAANGITTIRGMLGHEKHLALRDAINRGDVIGPHFYTTGPSFNGMSVRSPGDGASMVRGQHEAGYDYLKLHPGLTREKFEAISKAAKEVGIPFAGHVSYGVGVWRAIEAGYSSIDHLDGFIEGLVPGIERIPESEAGLFGMHVGDKVDRSQIPKLMKALKDKNIWVVPTQALAERWFHPRYTVQDFERDPNRVYVTPEVRKQWASAKQNLTSNPKYDAAKIERFIELRRELILECQKNGVGLLLGCDAPQIFNVPGFSTHQELEYLVLAGLTPWQAITTGTVNVAKYLGRNDSGTVKKGAVADLVLLNSNPVSQITNSLDIYGVMIQGRWMDRKFLNAELKKLEK